MLHICWHEALKSYTQALRFEKVRFRLSRLSIFEGQYPFTIADSPSTLSRLVTRSYGSALTSDRTGWAGSCTCNVEEAKMESYFRSLKVCALLSLFASLLNVKIRMSQRVTLSTQRVFCITFAFWKNQKTLWRRFQSWMKTRDCDPSLTDRLFSRQEVGVVFFYLLPACIQLHLACDSPDAKEAWSTLIEHIP